MSALKKIFFLSITAVLLFAVTSNAIEENVVEEGWLDARLADIERMKNKGEPVLAQRMFEELLKLESLSQEQLAVVTKEYQKNNFEILLSQHKTDESKVHTVVTGDSLYKIARANKTTVGLIKRVNNLQKDVIYPGMKLKVVTGKFSIHVDKSDNRLQLFLEGRPIKTYSVSTGENNNTPTGKFKIVNKLEDPTWYRSGAVVPPGDPENGLGSRWLGFDLDGYGIHGTIEPDKIGEQVTAGCVRMLNPEVEELYSMVPVGTSVIVVN